MNLKKTIGQLETAFDLTKAVLESGEKVRWNIWNLESETRAYYSNSDSTAVLLVEGAVVEGGWEQYYPSYTIRFNGELVYGYGGKNIAPYRVEEIQRGIFSRDEKDINTLFLVIVKILNGETLKKVDSKPEIKDQKGYEETLSKFLSDPRVKHAIDMRNKHQERVYALCVQ